MEHFKEIFANTDTSKFVVSLGDLGESKDCTGSGSLFAGTTECFKLARDYLDGYGVPFDVVGGNHDLEGIDEFFTDEANLEAYLKGLGKETPQFCHEVAEKTLVVGLGSTAFRSAKYTSHEVVVDDEQIAWFEETIKAHPASEGWKIFCFSHAPIIGSGLRVLQECHVVNGCCWLNHNDGPQSRKFIETIRENPQIKGWFSGHFHLSHDYEDSMSFPEGNNRGSCVFGQTAVMTARSTRDGRRQSRLIRGNKDGFEICTVNHAKGGEVRVDATVTYCPDGGVSGRPGARVRGALRRGLVPLVHAAGGGRLLHCQRGRRQHPQRGHDLGRQDRLLVAHGRRRGPRRPRRHDHRVRPDDARAAGHGRARRTTSPAARSPSSSRASTPTRATSSRTAPSAPSSRRASRRSSSTTRRRTT